MDKQKTLANSSRDCARVALEKKGFVVRNRPGPGVPPGSRIWIYSPGEERQAGIVRVSKKRRIGISRHPWSGNWFEVPGLNEVIVVAPSLDDPMVAEVFRFDAKKMIKIFDRLDRARNGPPEKNRKLNFPIFAALDPQPGDDGDSDSSNLGGKASWIERVPFRVPDHVSSKIVRARATNPRDKCTHEGFVERVRREYAELNGVDVKKVFINIRYVEE